MTNAQKREQERIKNEQRRAKAGQLPQPQSLREAIGGRINTLAQKRQELANQAAMVEHNLALAQSEIKKIHDEVIAINARISELEGIVIEEPKGATPVEGPMPVKSTPAEEPKEDVHPATN